MAMSEEKKKYFAEYKKTHLKKIQAEVQISYYERLKNICELEGVSTTKFVKDAVNAALVGLEEEYGINPKWKIRVYTDKFGKKRYTRIVDVDFGATLTRTESEIESQMSAANLPKIDPSNRNSFGI